MRKHNVKTITFILILIFLLASIGLNVWCIVINPFESRSYIKSDEQTYIMEAGILKRNFFFQDGADITFNYDFDNPKYAKLSADYDIARIAGGGSEFDKAKNLMNEFSNRLTHKSNFNYTSEMDAVSLLEYALDNKAHGINCRAKAQILNEMCLSLGIYSRKVWILPNSEYDDDCHVVNEVWDSSLGKWVMLDVTNNEYWIDENGTLLSVLEIRQKGANREFCTPVKSGDNCKDPQKLREKYMDDFLYIMKNMVYMNYLDTYTVGETEPYVLLPIGFTEETKNKISEASVRSSPTTEA